MIKFVRDAEMVDSYSRAGVSDDNHFLKAFFEQSNIFEIFQSILKQLKLDESILVHISKTTIILTVTQAFSFCIPPQGITAMR